MNTAWQNFLEQQQAHFSAEGVVSHFASDQSSELQAAFNGNTLCDLSDLGLITATGEEAQEFLQSQLTNDLRLVNETTSQLSAYCSAKGRMLALFNIVQSGDSYYLQLPHELLESTMKRLQMFIMRAKVVLEDATDSVVRIGLSGPQSEEMLQALTGSVPQEPSQVVTAEAVTVQRLPGAHPRFELYGAAEKIEPLWQALAGNTTQVGRDAWSLLETLSGTPEIYNETVEAFVPQMTNLQLIDGVNFRKGCYPGQEVVARMQYLGKLKRRMYLAHVDTAETPQPGSELFDPESESGQGAGKVVRSGPHPDGGFIVLVVTQIVSAEGDRLQLGSTDGPKLKIEPLPYPFETEEAKAE